MRSSRGIAVTPLSHRSSMGLSPRKSLSAEVEGDRNRLRSDQRLSDLLSAGQQRNPRGLFRVYGQSDQQPARIEDGHDHRGRSLAHLDVVNAVVSERAEAAAQEEAQLLKVVGGGHAPRELSLCRVEDHLLAAIEPARGAKRLPGEAEDIRAVTRGGEVGS